MDPSARKVAELNIERYRSLLRSETDQLRRQTIVQLLAEEEEKLARLSSQPNNDQLEPRRKIEPPS